MIKLKYAKELSWRKKRKRDDVVKIPEENLERER